VHATLNASIPAASHNQARRTGDSGPEGRIFTAFRPLARPRMADYATRR
jgi:hypothetical protein